MRTLFLSLALIATVPAIAHARIGETPDQLTARYGQPLKEADQKAEGDKISLAQVIFQKGGFEIDVTITGGVSVEEVFKKLNGQPITVEEARILLAANSGGLNWSEPQKTADSINWTRDDQSTAKLASDGSMTVRAHELVTQEAAAKKLEERPTLDGF